MRKASEGGGGEEGGSFSCSDISGEAILEERQPLLIWLRRKLVRAFGGGSRKSSRRLVKMAKWGYKDENGPSKWHQLGFPIAKEGARQSPIDIDENWIGDGDAGELKEAPIKWSYDKNCCKDVENTGASWKVNVDGAAATSLEGGPLARGDVYRLWQFHAHWGADDGRGSEHTVNGRPYPGELHLVHWNTRYGDPGEAVQHPDGLCVLGRFFRLGEEEANPEMDRVTRMMKKIKLSGQKASFVERDPEDPEKEDSAPDPAGFLKFGCGASAGYWTYEGSLTTPPLNECVLWVVFKEPLVVTSKQLDAMRSLVTGDSCDCKDSMQDNFRPPCPTNERKIRTCRPE